MTKVTANLEFSGLSDYWSGNGRRWDDDAACVFAFYGPETTLADIIQEAAADDSDMDSKELWEQVSDADILDGLLDALTAEGKRAYDANEISEWSRQYGQINGHDYDWSGDDSERECDCCKDDGGESPMIVFLLEIDQGGG